MDMTRRRIVALGAALPLVGLGVEAIAAAPSAPPATGILPLGHLVDTFELAPDPRYSMFASAPTISLHVRKIWDGEQFVRFDSTEGTAVLNKLLQGRA